MLTKACRIALLLSLWSMAPLPGLAVCSTLPGANQIWSATSLHWVVVGEIHGTNESPEEFDNLVCDALEHGRSITVGLERPASEQAPLEDVLFSKHRSTAIRHLLAEPGWNDGAEDGRASQAMLRLLLKMRKLHRTYPELRIFAFELPPAGDSPGSRDEAMGKALFSLGEYRAHDLVLILTGNTHAFQAPMFGYPPMASYLLTGQTLSLEVTDEGGEAWMNMNGACGIHASGAEAKGGSYPRGIILDPKLAPFGKVDGILSLGKRTTASPPAAGELRSTLPCRQKYLSQPH
jgi:hypothetical protein